MSEMTIEPRRMKDEIVAMPQGELIVNMTLIRPFGLVPNCWKVGIYVKSRTPSKSDIHKTQ
jgi:hypothetical protein